MAKRRRLSPAQSEYLGQSSVPEMPQDRPPQGVPEGLEVKSMRFDGPRPDLFGGDSGAPPAAPPSPSSAPPAPAAAAPIARVAAESAATAALREVSAVLESARAEGRLLLSLPLAAVDTRWLVRDRIEAEEPELDALVDSLRAHGQRTPVEVVELAPGRYGLISGWRRITALSRLAAETGEARFGRVLAQLRRPGTESEAYVAMVEENEVRLGLSYYERARIAARATERGVFDSEKAALLALFATASRPRRSKIRSFLAIYRRLDPVLRYPSALPERLGLRLARALDEAPERVEGLERALRARPAASAEEELGRIAEALGAPPDSPGGTPEEEEHETGREARVFSAGAAAEGAESGAADVSRAKPVSVPAEMPPRGPGPAGGDAVGSDAGGSAAGAGIAGTGKFGEGGGAGRAEATEIRPGLFLDLSGLASGRGGIRLYGAAVGPDFLARLEDWLRRG